VLSAEIQHVQITAEAYRWDGEVSELTISGPPWEGQIIDPFSNRIDVDTSISAVVVNRWLTAASAPQSVDPRIGELVTNQLENSVFFSASAPRPAAPPLLSRPSIGYRMTANNHYAQYPARTPTAVMVLFISACWTWLAAVFWDLRRPASALSSEQKGTPP
jgi:hypothetical protein